MSAAEYAAVTVALITFALGCFAGHAAGYYRASRVRRRKTYRVLAPNGLSIATPSRESAEQFAHRYGGRVTVGRPE